MPALSFDSASKLAVAWRKGEITNENGSKLPTRVNISRVKFSGDLFFDTGRHRLLKIIELTTTGAYSEEAQAETEDKVVGNHNVMEVSILDQIKSKKLCPGFERAKHEVAIVRCRWNGSRSVFSPVVMDNSKCWSVQCKGKTEIDLSRMLCVFCKAAQKRLWNARSLFRKPFHEEGRIRTTPNKWLTHEEQIQKKIYMINDHKLFLRKKNKEIRSLKRQLASYQPVEAENREAIRAVVKMMDKEQQKVRRPVCKWIIDDERVCGHEAQSIVWLQRHVREVHFGPQIEFNKRISIMEKRIYNCNWHGCRREASFDTFQRLRKHVIEHTGNGKTGQKLDILREQMINSVRQPTGRRYQKKTKQVILENYRSRADHNRTRNLSILPVPSVRTVSGWKNQGGIKAGIDWTVLTIMQKIGSASRTLCHGLLTFDEVRHESNFSSAWLKTLFSALDLCSAKEAALTKWRQRIRTSS
jgi:hypothetical protein